MEHIAFEEYKLKVDYLKAQYERLLSRFNYFLTVEMALFGFLGWVLFDLRDVNATRLPALLGISISLLWYVVAAEDSALVKRYRDRAEKSATRLGPDFAAYHPASRVESHWGGFFSWYWRPLRVTRLPVYAALLTALIWLGILTIGTTWLESLVSGSSCQELSSQ